MRILVLTNIFPTDKRPMGGSYVVERVEAHRRAGHEVDVLALQMKPDLVLRAALRRTGRDDESGPVPGMTPVPYRMSALTYARRRFCSSSRRLAEKVSDSVQATVNVSSYDRIHAHGMFRPPAGVVAQLLSERTGVPYVITAHGTDVNVGMRRRPEEFIDAFEKARAVMYVSPPLMETALSLGAPRRNAVHVPNGVDLDVFGPGQVERGPELLYVGNLAPVKGADRLPEVWEEVRAAVPEAHLTVIGVGQLEHQIRPRLEAAGATFLGQQPRAEVATAMGRSRALLIPSRSEGWPCVILEAQATGTPVVATDVGGIPDAVGDGGQVVEAGADDLAAQLASRTAHYLQHPANQAVLRDRASHYSWDEIARQEREAMG